MRKCKGIRIKSLISALVLVIQAVFACWVFSGCASAGARSIAAVSADDISADELERLGRTDEAAENYSRWLSDNYSSKAHTRAAWLSDMTAALGIKNDSDEAFPYAALTREYAAETIVRALEYTEKEVSPVADAEKGDALMTLAYYGYFVPDDDDMLYPQAIVTKDEYEGLLTELKRYKKLGGKKLLSFGDSIMYGLGNSGEGIADMIAEKYGMLSKDYAVSGATFGIYEDRSHIADQVKAAAKTEYQPDIILIDGATNDMLHVKLGSMTEGKNIKKYDEKTFAGGMEYSLSLLEKYYKDVPVLYVRAHDMAACDDKKEQEFGKYGLKIAEKWGITYADIYEDTLFDTEIDWICEKYTLYREKVKGKDSIHPTALGYAKYYLPLICDSAAEIL